MIPSPLLIGATSTRDRVTRMGIARVSVGLSVGVSPSLAGKIFGAPDDQLTPAARLLARLFGVRNVALGAWTLAVRDAGEEEQHRCFQVNALVDIADLAVLLPLMFRSGLRRAAFTSSLLAVSATLGWLELLA